MTAKPKVILLCDQPRVLRAVAAQIKNWVDLYDADTTDRLHRLMENHDQATILVTQLLLRKEDCNHILLDLRQKYPRNRRCMLASYTDLGRVVDVIHNGLIDALVHVPIIRGQFLTAITGPSAVNLPAVSASHSLAA